MPLQWAIVFWAWAGAVALAAVPTLRHAAWGNVAVSTGTLLLAGALMAQPYAQHG